MASSMPALPSHKPPIIDPMDLDAVYRYESSAAPFLSVLDQNVPSQCALEEPEYTSPESKQGELDTLEDREITIAQLLDPDPSSLQGRSSGSQ
ncbi:hypothetical protein IFM47457_08884 [Aspergillus lentulus]|nr:hypothetical protein IFM47457_08884 [Aspergillus lentulus]